MTWVIGYFIGFFITLVGIRVADDAREYSFNEGRGAFFGSILWPVVWVAVPIWIIGWLINKGSVVLAKTIRRKFL